MTPACCSCRTLPEPLSSACPADSANCIAVESSGSCRGCPTDRSAITAKAIAYAAKSCCRWTPIAQSTATAAGCPCCKLLGTIHNRPSCCCRCCCRCCCCAASSVSLSAAAAVVAVEEECSAATAGYAKPLPAHTDGITDRVISSSCNCSESLRDVARLEYRVPAASSSFEHRFESCTCM